jgi:hypothetical protein
MTTEKTIEFPPLPTPFGVAYKGENQYRYDAFSAQQMHDYLAADQAQRQAGQEPALRIAKGERDGNWQEFDVNGHGGLIRMVARMEDDANDLPLSQVVERFLLYAAPQPAVVPDGYPPHAEVYVGNGSFAICDWADWETVKAYNWCLTSRNKSGCIYAQAWSTHDTENRSRVTMHGLVMRPEIGMVVDHIDGNGLDNRRRNLRIATPQQNAFNQKHHGGSSLFKGVSFDSESGLWRAYIRVNGVRKYLGRHGAELDAAKAYNMAAKEHFGEYAKPNNVD